MLVKHLFNQFNQTLIKHLFNQFNQSAQFNQIPVKTLV